MKRIIIIIVFVLIAGIAIVFMTQKPEEDTETTFTKNTQEIPQQETTSIKPAEVQITECSNEELLFTNAFVDNDKIQSVGAIGALDGGSHGRSYVEVKNGELTPVYAPADVVLEEIIYSIRSGNDTDPGEYGLWFRAGCNITFLLDHLDDISDDLKKIAPTEPSTSSATGNQNLQYKIPAGTLIAYTDGTPLAHTFDFLVLDRSKPVEYINPDRFEWDQNLYSQCPYDLFTEDLRNEYYALLSEPNKSNQDCGYPSFDKAGTAAGAWFQGEDTDTNGRWLTFGTYTNYSGLMIRQDAAGDFSVRHYGDKTKPADIFPGHEICYDYNGYWAYVKLLNVDELLVATGNGSCPTSFPENEASTWIR